MFENLPIHPAAVHLPIGIMVVLPIISILIMTLYFRGKCTRSTLLVITLLHAILMGTSYIAIETGEDEEHKVEKVISESIIENHEEKAEVFMVGTVIVFLMSLGLAVPSSALVKPTFSLIILGQLVLLGQGYRVGHSGGELVYIHGAAQAYTPDINRQDVKQNKEPYSKHRENGDDD